MLKSWGYWARRLPSREQKGYWSCVDGYYWDPQTQIFGYFQSKYRYELLKSEERERLIQIGKDWNCEMLFIWRQRGIRHEILKTFK
jgi:hypothetical protein